ncbi:hypothetical protein FB45DRAFT_734890, partial [Roridomyces roridus]
TEPVTDQNLLNLQAVLPRNLVVAALDLVDRGNVVKYTGPANKHYQVLGSTGTHRVFTDLPGPMSSYCSCPAFAYLVLSSETYIMCKHLPRCRLANKLDKCTTQPLDKEQLSQLILQE